MQVLEAAVFSSVVKPGSDLWDEVAPNRLLLGRVEWRMDHSQMDLCRPNNIQKLALLLFVTKLTLA